MSGLDALARTVGNAGLAAKLALRSCTNVDTNPVPKEWTHVTKVDPEDTKRLPVLYPLYLQHTSAISVGGSSDVNSRNTEETFELLDVLDVPVFHEPSAAHHVTERTRDASEFLAIPEVLNGDSNAIVGRLGEGAVYLRNELVPSLIDERLGWLPTAWRGRVADFVTSWVLSTAVFEAYIIQNVDSAAAREANVTEDDRLTPEEAAQRAVAAEKHLGSPVIYVEYSGRFGGDEAVDVLRAVREEVTWARVWYGGGIATGEETRAVLDAGADTAIVGNVFHDVADEERELVGRARRSLDADAPKAAVSGWVADEVDLRETSAFRYLSTIPGLDRPDRLAADYLARSVSLHLLLGAGSPEVEAPLAADGGLAARWEVDHEAVPAELVTLLETHRRPSSTGEAASSLLSHVGLTDDG